jgi:hypothetical protein
MALESRISKLEERHAPEPELACGLTAGDAYLAILHRRDLTSEEDPAKPGFYRLRKRPPSRHPTKPTKAMNIKLSPEQAYARMLYGKPRAK